MKQNWKTVIHSSDNLLDAITQFKDEYDFLLDFYETSNAEVDDATWVHVDEVRQEREEFISKIQQLEEQLEKRENQLEELQREVKLLRKGETPKKKLVKKKRVSRLNVEGFDAIDDDDLPF